MIPEYFQLSLQRKITESIIQEISFIGKTPIHQGKICAVCMQYPIIGFRFKCTVCQDYNLCQICESETEHPHIFCKYKLTEQ